MKGLYGTCGIQIRRHQKKNGVDLKGESGEEETTLRTGQKRGKGGVGEGFPQDSITKGGKEILEVEVPWVGKSFEDRASVKKPGADRFKTARETGWWGGAF